MCYKKFNDTKTFLESERYCKTQGGHLARISSYAENKMVGKVGGSGIFWIGLWSGRKDKCYIDKNRWVWTDGTPSTSFHRWGNSKTGQPHNPPDCHLGQSRGSAALFNYPYHNNHWEDTPIEDVVLPFICGIAHKSFGKCP